MRICCMLGEFKQGLCDRLKGGMRKEVGGKFRREGTWVYLMLILFDIGQKTTKICKVIILQVKFLKISCKLEERIKRVKSAH